MAIQQFAPINYAAMLPEIDLGQSLLAGAQIRAQRVAARQKQAELDAAQAQRDRWNSALDAVAKDPSAQNFATLMLVNPEASEGIKRSWDTLKDDQKASDLKLMGDVRGALAVGKRDLAQSLIQRRIDADRKAGGDTSHDEAMIGVINENPEKAAALIDYQLAAIIGHEKYAETLRAFGEERRADELQGDAVRKGKADADKAEVDAAYADDKAEVEIADKRNQIKNRDAGTAIAAGNLAVNQQNASTAAFNAQTTRLSHLMPKPPAGYRWRADGQGVEPIPGSKEARDLTEAQANKKASQQTFVTAINTLDRLTKLPGFGNAVGWEAVVPALPGTNKADFNATLETFKAQTFLPMVQSLRGMGALSDAEGKKLNAAVGALDPTMSERAFKDSLRTIRADLVAAYKRAGGKTKPASGTGGGGKQTARDRLAAEFGVNF